MKSKVLIFITAISFITFVKPIHSQGLKSDTIDIINYTIDLDLKYLSHKKLYATTVIKGTSRMNNINSFTLDLRELTVDSIFFNGIAHNNYTYNDTLLRIILPSTLSLSDTFTLKVVYHGEPLVEPYDWGGFHFLSDSSLAYNLGIAFQDYPHNYGRVWFPCIDDFIDRATYNINITTKSSHKASCGGILMNITNNSDGSITWHWELADPIPTYLASVAVGNFIIIEDQYIGINDTIPISIYVRPQDSAKAVVSFSDLTNMLEVFEEKYGAYKWSRVGFTGTQKGAMEHATNIAFPRHLITGNRNYDWLIAHELAHSWFGNLMTCASSEDMWINEGWARFSEAIYFEWVDGLQAYKDYIMGIQRRVLNFAHTSSSGGDGSYLPLTPLPHTHTYGTTAYDKGSLVAHTLRGYLGDSIFFDAIQALLDHYSFQPISSYQMRDFLSQHTGINLNAFFDGWVFTEGFPHFSIDSVQISQNIDQGYDVTVFVKQKLKGRSTYIDENIVEIGFYLNRNYREVKRLTFSGSTGQQTFWLPFEPQVVLMDPDDRIADAITSKTTLIGSEGEYTFADQFCRFVVNSLSDTIMLRIEHSFATPDPLPQPIDGLTISPNRYWKISGFISENSDIDARFNYSTGNMFDDKLITNNQDSLVILYRKDAGDIWQSISFTRTPSPYTGIITVPGFELGEYVLAIWDKDHIGIDKEENRRRVETRVFPNPVRVSGELSIETGLYHKIEIEISEITGAVVYKKSCKEQVSMRKINIPNINTGIYIINISDHNGNIIYSDKLTIYN